jgi:hypothetical protein
MSSFTGEFKLSVGIAVEPRTKSDEITNANRAFFDQHAHSIDIAKACARSQGVGQMQVGGIGITAENGGDATLGPTSSRLFQRTLGEHTNTNSGLGCCPHCSREPGHAGTHHEKIEFSGHRYAV